MSESSKSKLAPGLLLALVAFVGTFEGLRTVAYSDPVGIPTICFGYTHGVKLGDTATKAQCDGLLQEELLRANQIVNRCIRHPLTDGQRGALVSLTYNAGAQAVCGSTLQTKFNQGDSRAGCEQIKRWVYAKGIKLPGLVRRREAEFKMCTGDQRG